MKTTNLFYLLIFFSISVKAQVDSSSQTTNKIIYEILRNAPEEHNNLSFAFSPLIIELYAPNTSFCADLYAQYMFKDKFSLAIGYKKAYIDYTFLEDNIPDTYYGNRGVSVDEMKSFNSFDITAKYYFNKKNKSTNEALPLSMINYTRSAITYSTLLIPAKKIVLYGLRLGFSNSSEYIYNKKMSGKKIIDFPFPQLNIPEKTDDRVGTMQYMKTINIGILITNIHDIYVDIDYFGTREKKVLNELYFDILIAAKLKYSDIIFADYDSMDNTANQTIDPNSKMPKTNFGFRLGYNFIPLKKFQFIYGGEIGYKPGVLVSGFGNLYCLIKFGFLFNSRI